jgi:hypothetical protein
MTTTRDYRPLAYLILLLGAGTAAAAALVPHYTAGYRLDTAALLAVLAPFVAYATLTERLRGGWLLASGVALLAINLGVVVDTRYVTGHGTAGDVLYWAPLLSGALVLALAYAFGRLRGSEALAPTE